MTVGNISGYSFGSISQGSGTGKLYVPVSRAALMYSHFDHVSGVAAKNGQNGISISKIRILNSLIERLSSIKSEPRQLVTDITNEQADALIENYQKQIQSAAAQNPYIMGSAQASTGSLFSFTA